MPTANNPTQVCLCGHGQHEHQGPAGEGPCMHQVGDISVWCPCRRFSLDDSSPLREGEQRRHVTED